MYDDDADLELLMSYYDDDVVLRPVPAVARLKKNSVELYVGHSSY